MHYLKELDEWSKKWLMSFNPDKTENMLIQIPSDNDYDNFGNHRLFEV
jgi:hypothetical protein